DADDAVAANLAVGASGDGLAPFRIERGVRLRALPHRGVGLTGHAQELDLDLRRAHAPLRLGREDGVDAPRRLGRGTHDEYVAGERPDLRAVLVYVVRRQQGVKHRERFDTSRPMV